LNALTDALTASVAVFNVRPATSMGALVPTLIAGFDDEQAFAFAATDAGELAPTSAYATADVIAAIKAITLMTAAKCIVLVLMDEDPPQRPATQLDGDVRFRRSDGARRPAGPGLP
jgi:hypothetical protein